MKVSEFKKLGLEFVEGDCGDGFMVKDAKAFNQSALFTNCEPTEFAWRENTGVKPEFRGFKELKLRNGKVINSNELTLACWAMIGHDADIIKWRPSLNQPQQWPDNSRIDEIGQNGNDGLHYGTSALQEAFDAIDAFKEHPSNGFVSRCVMMDVKPVFTQAMSDAGELPPVGSLFIDLEYNENKHVLALAHHLGKVVYAADYDDVSQVDYFHADQDECKPIDTRTEKTNPSNAEQEETSQQITCTLESTTPSRAEIAMHIMASIVGKKGDIMTLRGMAADAVDAADALISELNK